MSIVYDQIGDNYDTTRRADSEISAILAKLTEIYDEGVYLDVACGTGNYTVALADMGGQWHAFDQSETMLAEARLKSRLVSWDQCHVEKTRYASNFFDAAMCTLAIHHFPDLPLALKEVSRILKSHGQCVIFTSTPEQMDNYWLTRYFPNMMLQSKQQMPSISMIEQAAIVENLRVDNVQPFFISPTLQDFFLYSGKHRPEMYLSKQVRDGISSFRNLCSQSELEASLIALADDVRSGRINNIIQEHASDLGDYCFVLLKKIV